MPLPDLDLPSISLPDFPAWAHALVQIKNWALGAFVVFLVVAVAIDWYVKRDDEPPHP